MSKSVYIVSAKRTAIGSFMGGLKDASCAQMGSTVVRDIIHDTQLSPDMIDEVIVGNVLSAGQGQGVARQVALLGGVSPNVVAYGVNMVCGSGMKAVMNGVLSIQTGAHCILAGGVESMSQTPYLVPYTTRSGHKMGNMTLVDSLVADGLTDAFSQVHMGVTAENIAKQYHINREDQDIYAIQSQKKAIEAVDKGVFKDEITPLTLKTRKGEVVVDTDEYPNRKTSFEKLSQLRPAFLKDGTVTAGNASGLNDGASFVLLGDDALVSQMQCKPMAKILAMGQGGVDPSLMGLGPTPAIIQALQRANLSLEDMDVIELNEAFAAQVLGVIYELSEHYHMEQTDILRRTNVNGGAIALGHPIGASGNRILVTLVHTLKRTNKRYGLASLCIGGGMGIAIIIENTP